MPLARSKPAPATHPALPLNPSLLSLHTQPHPAAQVHRRACGSHRRHGQVLPPDAYLSAGIPLVLYLRDVVAPLLVELPEQSCHAFLSFR